MMDESLLGNLVKELKKKLRITWDDKGTNENLEDTILNADHYLQNLTNATFDFTKEKWVKDLLLERCRYDYHNAVDQFEMNFREQISRLQLLVAIGKVGKIIEQTNP